MAAVLFYDEDQEIYITLDELKEEYKELKANRYTEAECFEDYLSNCLEGTLIKVRN